MSMMMRRMTTMMVMSMMCITSSSDWCIGQPEPFVKVWLLSYTTLKFAQLMVNNGWAATITASWSLKMMGFVGEPSSHSLEPHATKTVSEGTFEHRWLYQFLFYHILNPYHILSYTKGFLNPSPIIWVFLKQWRETPQKMGLELIIGNDFHKTDEWSHWGHPMRPSSCHQF